MCDFHYLPIRQSEAFKGCFEDLVSLYLQLFANMCYSFFTINNGSKFILH